MTSHLITFDILTMPRKTARTFKVQANVEEYTHFVVENLIGIKGTNSSDVVSYVLKEWISEHRDELKDYGLSVRKKIKPLEL
jgi:hypothetical protein